jgi:hypothetical protein
MLPQGLFYGPLPKSLIASSSNKQLIIPHVLASMHGGFPAQGLKATPLGQAAIHLFLAN